MIDFSFSLVSPGQRPTLPARLSENGQFVTRRRQAADRWLGWRRVRSNESRRESERVRRRLLAERGQREADGGEAVAYA